MADTPDNGKYIVVAFSKVALRTSFVSGTSSRVRVALSAHTVDYDRQSLVLEDLVYTDVEPEEEWLVGSGTFGPAHR